MIYKLFICLFVLLFIGCNDSSKNDLQLKEAQTITNYKIELIKSLNLSENIDRILFVPDNSCKGCLKFTKDNCEKLSAKENLEIYYFNELNLNMNECTMRHQSTKLKIDYTNYDIYGITLFELYKDSISLTYVDATNIDSIYSLLLNQIN